MGNSALGIGPGTVIQDSYKVTRLLGEGGMGATFSGINIATQHEVAIKVILPEFGKNGQASELFRREANLLRTIQNPAIVRFETTLIDKSGRLYLVMEFIPGNPLGHFLERGARLASPDVLKLGLRIAKGLAAVHELGIVHRDLSPDNIMIPDDDILGAKLIDFGVASDTVGSEKSIIGSSFAGKISYGSPEQLGIGDLKVSKATDLYSLGLVLMKTAGLSVPGAGQGIAAAIDARRHDIRISGDDDPKISPHLKRVLEALLKFSPKDRTSDPVAIFQSAIDASIEKKSQETPAPSRQAAAEQHSNSGTDENDFGDGPLDAAKSRTTQSGMSPALLGGGLLGVLTTAAFTGWYFWAGPGAQPQGLAVTLADTAKLATQANDPLAEVNALIAGGTEDSLNAAFGALMALAGKEEHGKELRSRAAIMIAQMYDPKTFDPLRSPFPAANPNAAKRFYQQALDLGHPDARRHVERLDKVNKGN